VGECYRYFPGNRSILIFLIAVMFLVGGAVIFTIEKIGGKK